MGNEQQEVRRRELRRSLAPFRQPDPFRGGLQLMATLSIFFGVLVLALRLGHRSYPLGLALGLLLSPIWVRLFILQHDPGHGSLFRSARVNQVVGTFLGVITLTPFFRWRATHAAHHATSGNLAERRLDRDIFTMTVREYQAAPAVRRLGYRCFRHPLVIFALVPFFVFLVEQRFAYGRGVRARERLSVWGTNLGLAAIVFLLHRLQLLGTAAAVLLPMVAVSGTLGIWLFYIQHQFTEAYWSPREHWLFDDASILGSSHLELPPLLAWLSADIGIHHVHHLEPSIPNYRLRAAHLSHPALSAAPRYSLRDALRAGTVDLWDERQHRMVKFQEVRDAAVTDAPAGPRSRVTPAAAES